MSTIQPITGFRQDDEGDWVAELACGHSRHVRHNPPLNSRPWVLDPAGRRAMVGTGLPCKPCDEARAGPE